MRPPTDLVAAGDGQAEATDKDNRNDWWAMCGRGFFTLVVGTLCIYLGVIGGLVVVVVALSILS